MPGLRDFQASFARGLWSPEEDASTSALAGQPGYAVYRNTVMAACVDALTANYPTVHRLIGVDCFNDAATAFVRTSPPSSGMLAGYGQGFATFLSSVDTVAQLAYLPGVAMLDRFWTEAHFAADSEVLASPDLVGLLPEGLSRSRFVPHPAARWQTFETLPIYTLWQRHRDDLPLDAELNWRGESALVTRPKGAVAWTAIPPAAAVFLSSSASGKPFDMAIDDAATAEGADDASWLPALIRAGAFARLERRP